MAYDFKKIRFGNWSGMRALFESIFSTSAGHDHDGSNSKLVVGGAPADNSVTNTKMAADAKVGSLAALTTTVKTSLQAAINELVTSIGSLAALTTTVKTSAVAAINELVTSVGSLAALTTTAKTSAVAAINELVTNIGSLAALTTTAKNTIVAAVNELVTNIGSLAALTTTVKTSCVAAINELVTSIANFITGSGGNTIIRKQIALGGVNPTVCNFMGADVAATLLGTIAGTYNITAAQTFVVNPDGAGDVTATFNGARGTSKSGDTASQNMAASLDTKIKIAVDGGAAQTVTFAWAGCINGGLIATELQTKIQALGGAFAAVTVAFDVDHYMITSGTYGTGSAVIVTRADDHNATEELELGPDGVGVGGAETAGTGDAVNLAATTADEVATKLAALAGLTAVVEGGAVRITSDTAGAASSLVVNAACALDTVFGITGSDYGEEGLGLASNMADTNYCVMVQSVKDGAGVTDTYSVGNKAAGSFRIYAETAGSTDTVDLLIFGTPA